MMDAVRPKMVRVMGQMNPYGYGYSWNSGPSYYSPAPGTFVRMPAGAAAAAAAPSEEVAQSCFTCTDPSSGDIQYGVPSSMADQLRGKGYRCRKDECANRSQAQTAYGGFGGFGGMFNPGAAAAESSWGGAAGAEGGFGMLSGRIPLAGGLGRRALGR
jgi:hypothetical protein